MRITQVSSGLIATQTLTSFGRSAVALRRAGERHVQAEREAAAGERPSRR